MAKKTDAVADADQQTIDKESLDFLEQVRKGKPRNFVMSVKGSKVRSLLVKKKRIKKDELKAAKGGGFQPMFGVVEGMAANITFKIAKSDGFEDDPLGGQTVKLKTFLKDQTGKAFKPVVEVVSTPPPIPFDEEDLKDPLIARFMSMEAQIISACDAHPNEVNEIQRRVQEIRQLLEDDQKRSSAGPQLDNFETFLGQLGSEATAPTTDEPPAPTNDSTELAGKLAAGLKKLKPAVQQAILAAPDQKSDLVAAMTQVANNIKAEQFDEARTNMVALGKTLKEIGSGGATPTEPTESQGTISATELAQSLKSLKPALVQASEAFPDRKTELDTALAQIVTAIKGQQLEQAQTDLVALTQTVESLNSTEKSTGTGSGNLVEYGKSRLEWVQTRKQMHDELEKLKSEIVRQYEEDNEFDSDDVKYVTQQLTQLDNILTNLDETLTDTLDKVLNASDDAARVSLIGESRQLIQKYKSFIETDPVAQAVDDNEFTPVSAIAPALEALNLLEQTIV